MNKEEKSLLDEIWEASGLSAENGEAQTPDPKAEETPIEEAPEETPVEEKKTKKKKEKKEKKVKEKKRKKKDAEDAPVEEVPAEEVPAEEVPVEDTPAEEVTAEENAEPEKKKDIKFLAIYTTVFVVVIGLLIAGSYMISYRIHRQMADANNQSEVDFSQSTLQNVQDQRDAYKAKNETLTAENQLLTETGENADLLIGSVGDAMEQDDCLIAAQNAYIKEDTELATALMYAIDPAKLSEPNKTYYEQLAALLELELPVVEDTETEPTEQPKEDAPAAEEEQAEPKEEEPESKPVSTEPTEEEPESEQAEPEKTEPKPEQAEPEKTEPKPEQAEKPSEPEQEETEIDLPEDFNGIILPGYKEKS